MSKRLLITNQFSNMKKFFKTLYLGILAGAAIGIGSFVFLFFSYLFRDYNPGGKMFASMMFSVGLLTVCILGLNLYTGKIGVFLDDREKIKENSINLPIILLGNAIGAFALGILFHLIVVNKAGFMEMLENVSKAKTDSKSVFIEGFLCGALVYIAVYCFKNFQNWAMKIIGLVVSVTLFVYCGFQHCIANMFYFGIAFNWNLDMLWNLIIVIVTNSVGALFVRCLVHLAAIIKQK